MLVHTKFATLDYIHFRVFMQFSKASNFATSFPIAVFEVLKVTYDLFDFILMIKDFLF